MDFGPGESYRALLAKAGVERLTERREKAVEKFAKKCLAGAFSKWFPLNQSIRNTRSRNVYKEFYARCDRLRKTPVYYMRRMLNNLEIN